MAPAMLGRLPLSAVQKPRDVLEERLAGPAGELWLNALKKFLRKENPWERWKIAKDGVITFSVTTNGYTNKEWQELFKRDNYRPTAFAGDALLSTDLSSKKGIVYTVKVLQPNLLFDTECTVENIRRYAKKRNYSTPPAVISCLIREKFSDAELKEMDINLCGIVAMHEPLCFRGEASLFGVGIDVRSSTDDFLFWPNITNIVWEKFSGVGFAFISSEESEESVY